MKGMMNLKPDVIMKKIAEAVKAREELASVVCRYTESTDTLPNPVCAFTLFFGTGKSGFVRNSDNSLKETLCVKLCLLAPTGAGGKRLGEMAQWVAEAVRGCVNAEALQITETRIRENTNSLYREILVEIEESVTESQKSFLRINGKDVEGFVSAQVQSVEETEKKGQLLNGYTVVCKEDFLLSITTSYPLRFYHIAEIELGFNEPVEVYEGIEIIKSSHKITSEGNHSFVYEIKAETVKTEVDYEQ